MTRNRSDAYFGISPSVVNRVMSSTIVCAIKTRSNGSLWIGGKVDTSETCSGLRTSGVAANCSSASSHHVLFHRRIPTAQQLDTVLHAAEADLPTCHRCGSQLGDGLAVAGNYDSATGLNRADEFWQAILGFGDADIHG